MSFNFQTTQATRAAAVAEAHAALAQQTAAKPGVPDAPSYEPVLPCIKNAIHDAVQALGEDPERDVYVAASGYATADNIGATSINLSLIVCRAERVRAAEPASVTVETATDVGGQLADALEGAAAEIVAGAGEPDTTGHE